MLGNLGINDIKAVLLLLLGIKVHLLLVNLLLLLLIGGLCNIAGIVLLLTGLG